MAKITDSEQSITAMMHLLQSLVAIEYWRGGLSQAEIGKRLGVATGTVNKMLKGVSRSVATAPQPEAQN